VVEETFDTYFIKPTFERAERGKDTYMVESFFVHDWKPLVPHELERALKLLAWSRADLLSLVGELDEERLSRTYPNERWPIRGILKHIGGAEWWYQERIGYPFPENEADVPSDPFERLEVVRTISMHCLQSWMASIKWWASTGRSGVRVKCCGARSGMKGIIRSISASYLGKLLPCGGNPYAKFHSISCKIETAKWLPWHCPPGQVCPLCSSHSQPITPRIFQATAVNLALF